MQRCVSRFVRAIGILNVVKKFFVDFDEKSTIPVLTVSKPGSRSLISSCDVGDVVKVHGKVLALAARAGARCVPVETSARGNDSQSRSGGHEGLRAVNFCEQMFG